MVRVLVYFFIVCIRHIYKRERERESRERKREITTTGPLPQTHTHIHKFSHTHEPSDDLTVSELLKYGRGSLDESTMAEINFVRSSMCVGKLYCIPSCVGSDHDDFAVKSVMGVVNQ